MFTDHSLFGFSDPSAIHMNKAPPSRPRPASFSAAPAMRARRRGMRLPRRAQGAVATAGKRRRRISNTPRKVQWRQPGSAYHSGCVWPLGLVCNHPGPAWRLGAAWPDAQDAGAARARRGSQTAASSVGGDRTRRQGSTASRARRPRPSGLVARVSNAEGGMLAAALTRSLSLKGLRLKRARPATVSRCLDSESLGDASGRQPPNLSVYVSVSVSVTVSVSVSGSLLRYLTTPS